jgi:Hemerythrin HHE cation binding domain
MARTRLFDLPHKTLRFAFNELLTQAGRTDFAQNADAKALKETMKTVFTLVKSHSHHEDDICFADLDQIAPNATRHDREEHLRLHHRLDTLLVDIKTILECINMGQDESEAGRALYADLCDLHAEMLVHMMEEERDTQPIFWKYMTDEQIAAFEPRIMGAMSPEMSALWLRYIVAALSHAELVALFTGMRANAPSFVFEANMRLAQEVLNADAYGILEAAFQPAFA